MSPDVEPAWKEGPRKRTRRRPLSRVSRKRYARKDDRDACRLTVMDRCGGACEACPRLHSGPVRAAVDVHEIKTRARGGSIYDPANCLGVCRVCHDWITGHPARARELGLVVHSWESVA